MGEARRAMADASSSHRRRPQPRRAVAALKPVPHGGTPAGVAPGRLLDFTANINPFGPPPEVYDALRQTPVDALPDPEGRPVLEALARRLAVPPDHLILGNGSAEVMQLLALAYLEEGDRVVIFGPAFGEYQRIARMMGASVTYWTAREEDLFQPRLGEMAQLLARTRPKAVFLCHPNNPTGTAYPMDWLARQLARFPETLFVVDEAYHPFTLDAVPSALRLRAPNLLVLRTLTKDHALAGLRIGYAVADPVLLAPLRAVRPPWNVNTYAQAAAVAALRDPGYVQDSLRRLHAAVQELRRGLQERGFFVVPSVAHFFLVRVGDATAVRDFLLQNYGVQVRDCTSFGLPAYIRVASLRPEENAVLLKGLEAYRRRQAA